MSWCLLEPDLEGQGGFEKVEELGKAFQDAVGLEARGSLAYSWDNVISPSRKRQIILWGVKGNKIHKVETDYTEL